MDDYISREMAIKEIKVHICFGCPFKAYSCTPEKCGTNACMKAISEIPTADVQPVVRSRWIEIDDYVLCGNCGVAEHSTNRNYCNDCGADMRVERVKEDCNAVD